MKFLRRGEFRKSPPGPYSKYTGPLQHTISIMSISSISGSGVVATLRALPSSLRQWRHKGTAIHTAHTIADARATLVACPWRWRSPSQCAPAAVAPIVPFQAVRAAATGLPPVGASIGLAISHPVTMDRTLTRAYILRGSGSLYIYIMCECQEEWRHDYVM